jgi:dihydrofolate reductase
VAASLDGYIAGPQGEYDWIPSDPDFDFQALFAQFDTFLIGRRTFEAMASYDSGFVPKGRTIVVSRTLRQSDHPRTTIVSDDELESTIAALRAEPGKDIWLFGGGSLFASMLDRGLVDTVEIALCPVLLGGGIPLLLPPAKQTKLRLTGHKVSPKSGIVLLEYAVV